MESVHKPITVTNDAEQDSITPLTPSSTPSTYSPYITREESSSVCSASIQDTNHPPSLTPEPILPAEETYTFLEEKLNEIGVCLNGVVVPMQSSTRVSSSQEDESSNFGQGYDAHDDERIVDLWQLRDLALSRGGLVNASMRKRAWPKLIGIDTQILETTASIIPSHFSSGQPNNEQTDNANNNNNNNTEQQKKERSLSSNEMKQIKRGILESQWNVEHHIKTHRRQERYKRFKSTPTRLFFKESDPTGNGSVLASASASASVTSMEYSSGTSTPINGFFSAQQQQQQQQRASSGSIRNIVSSKWRNATNLTYLSPLSKTSTQSLNSMNKEDGASVKDGANMSVTSRTSHSSRGGSNSSARRAEENMLLLNIITSVMRMVPNDADGSNGDGDGGDDRYHFYKGFVDVAAILLINLESPSLTSLALKQLAQSHFRDALKLNKSFVHETLRCTCFSLLYKVDRRLHDYLWNAGVHDFSFAFDWIVTWFAHDIHNVSIASRFVDVFISSHTLYPYYFSVAMLTVPINRAKILSANVKEERELNELLSDLPNAMMTCSSSPVVLESFESVIELALSYITRITPKKLMSLAQKLERKTSRHKSLSLFATPLSTLPSFSTRSKTFSDMTLLKQASKMRNLGLSTIERKSMTEGMSEDHSSARWSVAKHAMGMDSETQMSRKKIFALLLCTIITLVVVWTNVNDHMNMFMYNDVLISQYESAVPDVSSSLTTTLDSVCNDSTTIESGRTHHQKAPTSGKVYMKETYSKLSNTSIDEIMESKASIIAMNITRPETDKIHTLASNASIPIDAAAEKSNNTLALNVEKVNANLFQRKPFLREFRGDMMPHESLKFMYTNIEAITNTTRMSSSLEDEWHAWLRASGNLHLARFAVTGSRLRLMLPDDIYVLLLT